MSGLPLNPVSILGAFKIECAADKTVTTTPAALAAAASLDVHGVDEIVLQNDPASTPAVLVGDSTRQTLSLAVGASLSLSLRDPTQVFVKTASGSATLHVIYLGRS